MIKSNLNFTRKKLDINSVERQLQPFLGLLNSSLNSSMKKFEYVLKILSNTNKLSANEENHFIGMESATGVYTSRNEQNFIFSKNIKQIDVYFPVLTTFLVVLLVVTLLMFYFLYLQFRSIKNRSKVSVTEMDHIVME